MLATATCLVSVSAGLGAERSASGLPEADAAAVAHVLNRIAFGPRPGDIARVQQMGLDAYIDEQLHPDRIDDSALDARLATFQTLTLSSQQLASRVLPAGDRSAAPGPAGTTGQRGRGHPPDRGRGRPR